MVRALERAPARSRLSWALLAATSVTAAALAVLAFNVFFGSTSALDVDEASAEFDAGTDGAVVHPDFGAHAPILPVGR